MNTAACSIAEPSAGETLWCAGLPLTQVRELGPEECAQLAGWADAQRRRALRAALGALVLALLAPLAGLWAGAITADDAGFVLAVVTVLCAAAPAALAASEAYRRGRALARDQRAGTVRRFSGPLLYPLVHEPGLARLSEQGLLKATAVEPQWVEVLPAANCVWQANGWRPRGWIAMPCLRVAEPPASAAAAAQWVQPTDAGGLHVHHRPLSEAELRELRAHHLEVALRPVPLALSTLLLASLPLWLGGRPDGFAGWLFDASLLIVAAISALALLHALRTAWPFGRDLGFQRVVIARLPELHPGHAGTMSLSPPIEALLASGTIWTVGGRPAPWRTVRVHED